MRKGCETFLALILALREFRLMWKDSSSKVISSYIP